MSIRSPYDGFTPATDATPRDSDLDPHAHCREREAAAIRAAVAAETERCARVADAIAAITDDRHRLVIRAVARAIREAPPPQEGT